MFRYFLLSIITSFLLTTGISSCTSSKAESEVEKMYKEVMIIHDEVMPEMSTIQRLKKQISKVDTSSLVDLSPDILMNQITQLEKADNAMMDWMASFKKPKKDTPQEIAIAYLYEEKKSITEVKNIMLTSIADGKKLMEKIKNSPK